MDSWLLILLLLGSIAIGGLIVHFLSGTKNQLFIKLLLAFSGGLLIAIAFLHFIPEIYHKHGEKIGIYVLIGFLVQLVLEYGSKGIEHGHIHITGKKIPVLLMISLSIHAVIEGIPLANQLEIGQAFTENAAHHVGHDHSHDHASGGLLYGILVHKIPVAIALMTLLYGSGYSKLRSWIILSIFALMSPLGLLIGKFGLQIENNYFVDMMLAIVVGMFLHVSTTIIFETSEGHKFNFVKLASILLGVALAFLIH